MKDQNPNPPAPMPEGEGTIVPAGKGEILLYQTEDGRTRVECRFQDETIWLSQAMMAELYQTDVRTIDEHLKDIYGKKELAPEATIRKPQKFARRGAVKQSGEVKMSEVSKDSTGCGCEASQTCRSWCRRNWFVVLLLLWGLLLMGLMSWFIPHEGWGLRRADAEAIARARVTQARLRQLHTAVNQFHMDNDRWPTQGEGLSVLVRPPAGAVNWPPGGYLETVEIPKDAWGRDFIFELHPNASRPFVIKSLGADGAEGGEGYDADVLSIDID